MEDRGFYESADSPSPLSFEVIADWWQKALASPEKILAIDEIQKINNWAEAIKKLWDSSKKKPKVVLTGSSALLVQKDLNETLAGRYEIIIAEHWNFNEAKDIFNLSLKEFIEFGCYPGSIQFLKDRNRWAAYLRDSIVEPALGRDLLQLHPVKSPALLRQIFAVACSLPASVISLQKLQGQLQGQGSLPTIQHYLSLLSSAFLVSGVQKFTNSQFHLRKSPPKLIIHDNALCRAFERPISQNLTDLRFGHYFENLVGARFLEAGWEVYYWNDRAMEVDFVVRGPSGENFAIEVKSSLTEEKKLSGLKTFCKNFPDFEPCLISLVKQKLPGIRELNATSILSLSRQSKNKL